MKTVIHVGDRPLILVSKEYDDGINIDELTSINYSNLYGEAATVSALLNKVGMWKSEAESYYQTKVLERSMFEASLKKQLRREANLSGGKFTIDGESVKLTEKSLEDAVILDVKYQTVSKEIIEAKRDLDMLDSLFWSVQDKSKKLNNILKPVTPEEFVSELIEGEINLLFIKKPKL